MITLEYAQQFMEYVKFSAGVMSSLDNHGYFRTLLGDNVIFYPKNPDAQYHSIEMTPGLDQSAFHVQQDVSKGRILLVAVASNSSGDYVIMEEDTGHMTLTGNLSDDLITYCHRVIKAIVHVTGTAQSLGMSPHDYVTMIAD